MTDQPHPAEFETAADVDEARRRFLRQSVYAVYATPVITALLVDDANAALSCTGRIARYCERFPNRPLCRRLC